MFLFSRFVPSIHIPIHPYIPIHSSNHLYAHPSIHPHLCSSICSSIHPHVCPSIRPTLWPSIHIHACPSIHTSTCMPIHPFIHQSISILTHPTIHNASPIFIHPYLFSSLDLIHINPSSHPHLSILPSTHASPIFIFIHPYIVFYPFFHICRYLFNPSIFICPNPSICFNSTSSIHLSSNPPLSIHLHAFIPTYSTSFHMYPHAFIFILIYHYHPSRSTIYPYPSPSICFWVV